MIDDMLRQFAAQTLAAQQAQQDHTDVGSTASVASTLAQLPVEQAKEVAGKALASGGNGAATMSSMPMPAGAPGTAGPPAAAPAPTPAAAPPGSEPMPAQLQIPQMPAQVTVNNVPPPEGAPAAAYQANADQAAATQGSIVQAKEAVKELDRRSHAASVSSMAAYDDANTRRKAGMELEQIEHERQFAAEEPLMQREIELRAQQTEAQKQVDDWHVATEQKIMGAQQEIHQKMVELAADNPGDLWGHWNAGQKIAGIIGIVAAGFSHQDATARVHQMATDAINAQQAKMEQYEKLGQSNETILKQSEALFGSKKAAVDNMYAGYYDQVSKQLKLVAARSANPIARAQMLQAAAALDQDSAKFGLTAKNDALVHQYQGMAELVQLTGMEQTAQTQQLASQAAAEKQRIKDLDGMVEGRVGTMTEAQHAKLAPVVGGGHALIDGIDELEKMADAMHSWLAIVHSPEEVEAQKAAYDAKREGLMKAFTEYANTGARIEESEKKRFEHLIPTSTSVQSGWAGVTGKRYGMHASRDTIVNIIRRSGDAISGGRSKFDADYPLYQASLHRDKNEITAQSTTVADADKQAAELRAQQAMHPATGAGPSQEQIQQYAQQLQMGGA